MSVVNDNIRVMEMVRCRFRFWINARFRVRVRSANT